jgi:tRNA threonylcarbamoyladenosine biosynthesis protein TsaB
MSILAFDTCLESCSVAVAVAPAMTIHARCERMTTGQAERLVPMIGEVMDEAGLAFDALDRIGVTTGPGSFTGMRIGVAAARALALSVGRPVVTLSSFAVMALSPRLARAMSQDTVVIAGDARRGQLYVQVFEPGQTFGASPPRLVSIAEAALLGGPGPVVYAGSGASHAADAASERGRVATAVLPDLLPDIRDAIDLVRAATPSAVPARPLYLRPPDAKPQDGKSLARTT